MRYFTLDEFDSPDEQGSGRNMDSDFLARLDEAREIAGVPFKINSGMRTIAWNMRVGGRIKSSHLKGVAADIHCNNSADRSAIIQGLIKAGFMRIGIANTFIHADTDTDKPNAIWLYQ